MGIKKYLAAVFDPKQDPQTRLFMQPTMVVLVAELAMFLFSLLNKGLETKLILGIGFLLTAIIAQLSYTYKKVKLGSAVIAALIVFGMLPTAFFATGGISGGTPIWFAAFVLYISLVMSGKQRFFFIIATSAVAGVCYHLAYQDPSLMARQTINQSYRSSLVALVLVSLSFGGAVSYALRTYREELERSNERGEEIDKLNKAQNQFFSNMSHEIRTPINTIIGLNEMILREEGISDEVAEDAMNIQAASRMLLHLINDILDMSKIESGKMEVTAVTYDTGAMLSDIVGMLWIRAKEKGLEFHIDVDPMLPAQLVGDEVKIKQVIINLLTNAIKYTKEGSVTLSIQYRPQEAGVGLVTYSVSDTGMGLKKESIPHLFSAFQRVDEEKNRYIEGTGLGLAIVKQFVDLMGGSIRVNSVYMQGSTFIVELPQRAVGGKEIGELNLELRHSTNRRAQYRQSFEAPDARILVVDDNSANLLVVTKLLRDTRVRLDTAGSGREALKKTLETQYHLIFMDHMMPEMDGIECLHEIRRQVGGLCRETRVVALTANAGSDTQALYVKEGFDGYLLKPVNGDELERELLHMLPRELIRVVDTAAEEDAGVSVRRREKKMQVAITTDSVCDLPRQLVKSREIAVQPYHVCTNDGMFLDGVETESRDVLEYMTQGKGELRSEAPTPGEYEAFFARQLLRANNVIHISMARKASDGFASATEATQTFDNVTVIDSGHLSSGLGLMVLAADQMAKNGMNADKIAQELERMKPRLHTSFIVESTEFLARSGRIGRLINKIGDGLMVHPVLVMRESRIVVGRIYAGTRAQSWRRYIAWALKTREVIDRKMLFITHAGLTAEELKGIAEEVKKKVTFEEVIFQETSPAISSNCGPGTFGLSFLTLN